MRKTKIVWILMEKCTSLKRRASATPTVCPSCGTQIASDHPLILELAVNVCCLVLLAAVLLPTAYGIAVYLDRVIQDLPLNIRSPELMDRWSFEVKLQVLYRRSWFLACAFTVET
jgi:hypothetical protein